MSIFFEATIARFIENMDGYMLVSSQSEGTGETAVLTNGNMNVKIVYAPDNKRVFLFTGEAGCGDDDYEQAQSYFFESSGDNYTDLREAGSVGNEFADTLGASAPVTVIPDSARKLSKKDRENDDTSAVYFVNRIPGILTECREPLLMHKEYFGMLLPNKFCEEVVISAVTRLLNDKSRKSQAEEFFAFLNKMYDSGDMDVKSIITMTILNSITGQERIVQ